MSTRNVTTRRSHSAQFIKMNREVNEQLEAFGAKTFGSLERRQERLERFKANKAKLQNAIRAEQERVQTRSRRRAAEILEKENSDDSVLHDHIDYVTSGMEAEEYLQWKLSDAWATYRLAGTLSERRAAREEIDRAMRNIQNFHNDDPLQTLAATAQMLSEYDDNDSDSEGSDYTGESS
jgi:hypothetical protein